MKKYFIFSLSACLLMIFMFSCSQDSFEFAETTEIDETDMEITRGQEDSIFGLLDITVGTYGNKWCIDRYGYVFWWDDMCGANRWVRCAGMKPARRISVGPYDYPLVCKDDGTIWRYINYVWYQLPGHATDVSIAGNGDLYIVGSEAGSQRRIWKWDMVNGGWVCWSNAITDFRKIDAAMENGKSVPYAIRWSGSTIQVLRAYNRNDWDVYMSSYFPSDRTYYADIGAGGGNGSTRNDTVAVLYNYEFHRHNLVYYGENKCSNKFYTSFYIETSVPGDEGEGRVECNSIDVYYNYMDDKPYAIASNDNGIYIPRYVPGAKFIYQKLWDPLYKRWWIETEASLDLCK